MAKEKVVKPPVAAVNELKYFKTGEQWADTAPEYMSAGAAGLDLVANIQFEMSFQPHERRMVRTGISIQLPADVCGEVRPRSGLALNKGLTVLNSPGTIDPDYTGEVCVILINSSEKVVSIKPGDRVAQLVLTPIVRLTPREIPQPSNSGHVSPGSRGAGGFGSTGES